MEVLGIAEATASGINLKDVYGPTESYKFRPAGPGGGQLPKRGPKYGCSF
jgi:hypothetical protein